jgi:peptidoglycan hydrolase CwlO-like protein
MKKDLSNHINFIRKMKRLAFFLAVVIFVASIPVSVSALTTKEKLEQAKQEYEAIKNQLNQTEDVLDDLKGDQKALQNKMNQLNEELLLISENLDNLENQIEEKNLQIETTEKELEEAIAQEEEQYECMQKRIQFMYEKSDFTYLEMFLETDSFTDFINFTDYMNQISEYDQIMLEDYQAIRTHVEETKAQLLNEKTELDLLKAEAELEKEKVDVLIAEVSDTMSIYASQIEETEAYYLEVERVSREKENSVKSLQKQLEEEIRLSQLAATSAKRDISEITFAEGDLYLLANLIYCEAGGEPYAGQLAVGAVVINRVLSSLFPDTMVGVIYQRKQFSPAGSGRLALALAQNKATPACYKAAQEAMNGMTNVGNCIFFRTPIEGLTGISIGGHIFY